MTALSGSVHINVYFARPTTSPGLMDMNLTIDLLRAYLPSLTLLPGLSKDGKTWYQDSDDIFGFSHGAYEMGLCDRPTREHEQGVRVVWPTIAAQRGEVWHAELNPKARSVKWFRGPVADTYWARKEGVWTGRREVEEFDRFVDFHLA